MAKQRSLYWDTLKGILIILVVLGHCGTALGNGLISAIYAFHMPLFILVSGYFSKKKRPANFIAGGYKRLIIIYLVFNTAYIALDIATAAGLSFNRLLTPSFALWYILSLIYWRLVLQTLPQKWLDHPTLVIAASFLLSLLVGFIPIGGEMSFQRAIVFWPFFIVGYYLCQYDYIQKIRSFNKWIASAFLIGLLVIVYVCMPTFYANQPYGSETPVFNMITRALQLLIAALLCFCVLAITPEKMGKITDVGKYTLLIYLLHPPVVKTLKVISEKVGYTPDLLIALIITAFSVVAIYSVRKLKIFKYLT